MGRPPHPGPRPAPLEFPFEQAGAARAAAEDAAAALSRLRATHEGAFGHIESGAFRGRTADLLRDRSREVLTGLDAHVDALRRQARAIEEDIAEAHRRRAARDAAIDGWWRAYHAWDDQQPAAEPGGRHR